MSFQRLLYVPLHWTCVDCRETLRTANAAQHAADAKAPPTDHEGPRSQFGAWKCESCRSFLCDRCRFLRGDAHDCRPEKRRTRTRRDLE